MSWYVVLFSLIESHTFNPSVDSLFVSKPQASVTQRPRSPTFATARDRTRTTCYHCCEFDGTHKVCRFLFGMESTEVLKLSIFAGHESAMYIKSSFPDQAKVSDCNAYEALWNRHDQEGWPDDLTLHIEGISGRKRTYQEFRARAVLAATALGSPVSDGFRETREMIAIISHNSLVRLEMLLSNGVLFTVTSRTMLYSFIRCFFLQRRSLC